MQTNLVLFVDIRPEHEVVIGRFIDTIESQAAQ